MILTKNKVEDIKKKFCIGNRRLANAIGVGEATIQKVCIDNRSITEGMHERIQEGIERILETCKSKADFDNEYPKHQLKLNKDSTLFKEGDYSLFYTNRNNELLIGKLTVNHKTGDGIFLDLGKYKYTVFNSQKSFHSGFNYLEIILRSKSRYLHLFYNLNFLESKIEFCSGILFFQEDHRVPIAGKFIMQRGYNPSKVSKEIKLFFREKRLNYIKLSKDRILSPEDLKIFLEKQNEKGWESIHFRNELFHHFGEEQYDIFLSSPINSLPYKTFYESKKQVEKIYDLLDKKIQFNVFWSSKNINSEDAFIKRTSITSKDTIFINEILIQLKHINNFIFINLDEYNNFTCSSSQLFQMGWVLSQSTKKRVIFFVKDERCVPFIVDNEKIKHFRVIKVKNYNEIIEFLDFKKNKIFDTEVFNEV